MRTITFNVDTTRPDDRQICEQIYTELENLDKEIKESEIEKIFIDNHLKLNSKLLDNYMERLASQFSDMQDLSSFTEELLETFKDNYKSYSKRNLKYRIALLLIYLGTSLIGIVSAPFLAVLLSIVFFKINIDQFIANSEEKKNIINLMNHIEEDMNKLTEDHEKLIDEYFKALNVKIKRDDGCLDYFPKKSLNSYTIYPEDRIIDYKDCTMYVDEEEYQEYCQKVKERYNVIPSNDILTIAKHVLNAYLATGEVLPMDMEVSYFVKVSLQHYLNSDLTNVEDLLKLYKENTNGKSLKRGK